MYLTFITKKKEGPQMTWLIQKKIGEQVFKLGKITHETGKKKDGNYMVR